MERISRGGSKYSLKYLGFPLPQVARPLVGQVNPLKGRKMPNLTTVLPADHGVRWLDVALGFHNNFR